MSRKRTKQVLELIKGMDNPDPLLVEMAERADLLERVMLGVIHHPQIVKDEFAYDRAMDFMQKHLDPPPPAHFRIAW